MRQSPLAALVEVVPELLEVGTLPQEKDLVGSACLQVAAVLWQGWVTLKGASSGPGVASSSCSKTKCKALHMLWGSPWERHRLGQKGWRAALRRRTLGCWGQKLDASWHPALVEKPKPGGDYEAWDQT